MTRSPVVLLALLLGMFLLFAFGARLAAQGMHDSLSTYHDRLSSSDGTDLARLLDPETPPGEEGVGAAAMLGGVLLVLLGGAAVVSWRSLAAGSPSEPPLSVDPTPAPGVVARDDAAIGTAAVAERTAPMPTSCGRCPGALIVEPLANHPVGVCSECQGLAVPQAALSPVLQELARSVAADIDHDSELPRTSPPAAGVRCPVCARPMTVFGYMETRHGFGHRCGPCREVWVDADQLPAMVMLYARTNLRREVRERALDEEIEGMERRLRASLAARFRSRVISSRVL